MNYIREINAFYDEMERNPLSASAVTLWHVLMHMNNKAMWSESFTVPGTVLRIKSGLTESSFKRARNELVEEGYIIYIPSKNRKAPTYKMISLYKEPIWNTDMMVAPSSLSSHVEDEEYASERHQTVHPIHGESDSIENDKPTTYQMESQKSDHHTSPKVNEHQPNLLSDSRTHLSAHENEQASSAQNPKAPQSTARHATSYSDHNTAYTPDHMTNHKVNRHTNHQTAPLYKQYINKKRRNKTSSDAGSPP